MLSGHHNQNGNPIAAALAFGEEGRASHLARLLSERSVLISKPSSPREHHRAETALQLYAIRRERQKFFDIELFAEPAWDILLILYWAEAQQLRLTVTTVCEAAQVPATTALRWISKLEMDGLISRTPHPSDGRIFRLSLNHQASERMNELMDRILAYGLPNPEALTGVAA